MFQTLIGLFSIIFFGGGFLFLCLRDRQKFTLKLFFTCVTFVLLGIFLIFDSFPDSGETIEMITGEEQASNNDTVIAGNLEYSVSKVGTENTINDFGDKAIAQSAFLILEFSLKNNSNSPLSMDINSPFYLISEDKFYEFDYMLSSAFTNNEIGSSGLWSSSNFINPGNEMSSYVVFDVPEEIANNENTQLLFFTDNSAIADIYFNFNQ